MSSRIIVKTADTSYKDKIVSLIMRLKMLNEELDPHYKVVDDLDRVVTEYVEQILQDEKTRIIIAEDETTGEIAGLIVYTLVDRIFYKPRMKAVITEFYVLPKYRRKRIGTLLIDKAIEKAREDGAGILTVIYPAGNVIAERFYKGKRFIPLQVELYKPL